MAEPYFAEIRMFAGNFAPVGWARCDGQLLSIAQNNALFALMGTTYGGDGEVTFGLPDLRGRIPIHAGSGPGLTDRAWGDIGGAETAAITSVQQLPPHSHLVQTTTANAASVDPTGKLLGNASEALYRGSGGALVPMHPGIIESSGGSGQPHANIQPFLCINFIIALFGNFPSE